MEAIRMKKQIEEVIKNKRIDKEQVMNVISLFTVVGGIVMFSFFSVGFNKELLFSARYWTNVCILIFISVYALPTGKKMGYNYLKNIISGSFISAKNRFLKALDIVHNKGLNCYFFEYNSFYYKRKRRRMQEDLISKKGNLPVQILDISTQELNDLVNGKVFKKNFKGKDIYFLPITQEQADYILKIKNGEFECTTLDSDFFVNETSLGELDSDTRVKNANITKKKLTAFNFGSRLFGCIMFACIFGAFCVDTLSGGGLKQACIDTITRLMQLIVSLIMGYCTEKELNAIDIDVLNYKASRLELFVNECDNQVFVPEDINEKARIQYEQYIAEEEKKRKEELKLKELNDKPIPKVLTGDEAKKYLNSIKENN
jgi:hypothetical protein